MSTYGDLIAYYDEHYKVTAGWSMRPGKKVFLGDRQNQNCRFCGQSKPKVSFRKQAHALPECIGNKSLFTYYECDECNEAFGAGCEDDFAKWSLPMRTMTRIRGKNGIPTIKQGPDNEWRIEEYPAGLRLSMDESEGFFEDDVARNTLRFHLRRPPYRPVMVVQAVIKMALSVMPESELPHFQRALAWIRPDKPPTGMAGPLPFIHTKMSGPLRSDVITVSVLTRKCDNTVSPYSFLLLMYGHEMIQMVIPSDEKDKHLQGKSMEIHRFPCMRDQGSSSPGDFSLSTPKLDELGIVKDDMVVVEVQYQRKLDHTDVLKL